MSFWRWVRLLAALSSLAATLSAHAAFEPWVVRNFRVEGAQRIAEGTIYNYLPINIGDTVDEQRLREASRALFQTGFFQDFEFRKDGDTLVIVVLERPTIAEFKFSGNKDIKDDDLKKSLTNIGLAQGKTFDRSVLEEVTRELTEEYYGRGKYGAQGHADGRATSATTRCASPSRSWKASAAKIREVNIVGNTSFTDKEILAGVRAEDRQLAVVHQEERPLLEAGARGRPREAEVVLHGPRLRRFPLGQRSGRDLARQARHLRDDQRHRRRPLQDLRREARGRDGRAGAGLEEPDRHPAGRAVRAELAHADREGHVGCGSVSTATRSRRSARCPSSTRTRRRPLITFFVDPKSRAYVRHINFNGTDNVNDEVLRREMRQMEGGYLSNALVDRSQVLLQRLPYIEKVEHETTPVPGSPDLVDVDFKIKEGLPGQFGGSLGYSATYGVTLGGNFVHSNFMGTGNRLAVNLQGGKYQKIYDANYTDAYRTVDGLSRTVVACRTSTASSTRPRPRSSRRRRCRPASAGVTPSPSSRGSRSASRTRRPSSLTS